MVTSIIIFFVVVIADIALPILQGYYSYNINEDPFDSNQWEQFEDKVTACKFTIGAL